VTSGWQRREVQRQVERRLGKQAATQVEDLSDEAFGLYLKFRVAEFDHDDALRLARESTQADDSRR
jgi:hypothetical protein